MKTVQEVVAEKIKEQKDRVALRESVRLKVKAERDKAKKVKDG